VIDLKSTSQYTVNVGTSNITVYEGQIKYQEPDIVILPIKKDLSRTLDPSKYTVTFKGVPVEVTIVTPVSITIRLA